MASDRESVTPDAVLLPAGAGPFRVAVIPGSLVVPMVQRGAQQDAVKITGAFPWSVELARDHGVSQ